MIAVVFENLYFTK